MDKSTIALANTQMLARLKCEREIHGLVLDENEDEDDFHKVIKRLIDEPPAPKRGKRDITKSRRR
jgi:hypothetical protein